MNVLQEFDRDFPMEVNSPDAQLISYALKRRPPRGMSYGISVEKKIKKIPVTTKINEDYANIFDLPSLSHSSRPNVRHPQEILT
jgi:hypothetical protein